MRLKHALVVLALIAWAPAREVAAQRPAINLNDIAAMVSQDQANAPRQLQGVIPHTLEERTLRLLRGHMVRCWREPVVSTPTEVTIAFELDQTGALRRPPRIVAPAAYQQDSEAALFADAALRAVSACAPYPFPSDPELASRYDLWDQIEMTFHSRP